MTTPEMEARIRQTETNIRALGLLLLLAFGSILFLLVTR